MIIQKVKALKEPEKTFDIDWLADSYKTKCSILIKPNAVYLVNGKASS